MRNNAEEVSGINMKLMKAPLHMILKSEKDFVEFAKRIAARLSE